MEKTINANIGSQAFAFETNAYDTLKSYLDDIADRLSPDERTETLADIETRLAELFRERTGNNPLRVITLTIIRDAMLQMGAPADFGERRSDSEHAAGTPPEAPRKLYRSRTDRSIAGICGGLGEFFAIDTTIVRIVTLLLIFLGGLSIWVYILLWIIIPEEPLTTIKTSKR